MWNVIYFFLNSKPFCRPHWVEIHVTDALRANNYLQNVISNILKKKSSTQRTNASTWGTCLYVFQMGHTLWFHAYINWISQPLTRLLQKHDIRVVSKPVKTLQQAFPSPKSQPSIELQLNVVYKISFAHCPWSYVGETGRSFETRKNNTRGMWSPVQGVSTLLSLTFFPF